MDYRSRNCYVLTKEKGMLLYGIAALFLNSVFRNSMMHFVGITIPDINYIVIIMLLIFAVRGRINPKSRYILAVAALFSILVLYSNISNSNSFGINVLLFEFIPGLLFLALYNHGIDYYWVFKKFMKVVNCLLLLIIILGILDYSLGGIINNTLASTFSNAEWAEMIRSENRFWGYRWCSIIGAPLMNAFFALLFLVLNNLAFKIGIIAKRKNSVYSIIAVLGIVVSGSRTAFILALFFIFISTITREMSIKRIIALFSAFIIIILITNSTIFSSTVGARLSRGNILNEGRFELLFAIFEGVFGKINLFHGGGFNYSRTLTALSGTATRNFEFPVLMFIFDYGVVATVIYYYIFLIYPICRCLKKREVYVCFCYLVLFVHLNTFNCLAQKYDLNILLSFILVVFMNIDLKRGLQNARIP